MPEFKLLSEFESLKHQGKILKNLMVTLAKEAIPHAFLFTGIQGVGKQDLSQLLSMACNCVETNSPVLGDRKSQEQVFNDKQAIGPCGQCRSCKKIRKGNHPDIIQVKPNGSLIKIDQIRALCQRLALKPYEAKQRFVIISEADTMNPEAGNALLKILEEPPDRTILVLTAGQVLDLLPTIISRCLHIRLNPIPEKYLVTILEEDHGIAPDEAVTIARMASGSLLKALSLHKNNWIDRRNQLIDEFQILRSKPAGVVMAFAEKISGKKDLLPEYLEIFKTWVRDLIVYRYAPDRVVYYDLKDKIDREYRRLNTEVLLALFDSFQKVSRRIESNVNTRLTMEILIMQMAGK